MIKIEINTENGLDARKELLDLLGINQSYGVDTAKSSSDVSAKTTVDNSEISKVETNDAPAAETTKKRRTKAEIEAEKQVATENTGSEEPPASSDTATTLAQDNADQNSGPDPEKPDNESEAFKTARLAGLEKSRAGFKEKVQTIIKTVAGVDSIKDAAAKHYAELEKQFNALA